MLLEYQAIFGEGFSKLMVKYNEPWAISARISVRYIYPELASIIGLYSRGSLIYYSYKHLRDASIADDGNDVVCRISTNLGCQCRDISESMKNWKSIRKIRVALEIARVRVYILRPRNHALFKSSRADENTVRNARTCVTRRI